MTSPHLKTFCASSLLFLFTTISHSSIAAAQYGMPQVRQINQRPYANSVILQGGTQAQTMQRLHVVRQYAFQNLRSNPRVELGEAHLDFTPMLSNPKALPNMAMRLQSMPQHVQSHCWTHC
jgi:hypothetical protein